MLANADSNHHQQTMQDSVDGFVELVEDLIDLRVVSVAMERLSALIQGGDDGARDSNAEILERRRAVLEKLSQTLTVCSERY